MEPITTTEIDKVPGSLEGVTWRKSTQDYGVTLAVPKEFYRYAKPLMGKENLYFVVLYMQVQDMQQAQDLLNKQSDEIPSIPSVDEPKACPPICSIGQLADLHMMSEINAKVLGSRGVFVKISRGRYDRDKSTQGYLKMLRELAQHGGSPDLMKERTRIAKENADRKVFENAVMRKQYISKILVERYLSTFQVEMKNKILASSSKAAPLISAGVQSTAEIKEVIDNILYDSLRDLADMDIGRLLMVGEATAQKSGAKTKAKSKRVVRKVRRTKSRK